MNLVEAVKFTSLIRRQQYYAGRVNAVDYKFLPKEKQLYIQSQNISSDHSKLYRTQIVFEGIQSAESLDHIHKIPFSSKGHGIDFYLSELNVNSRIRTRCQCDDYYFMWSYWNSREKALLGPHKPYVRVPGSNRPPVNPDESPGLCKHLLVLIKKLMKDKLIKPDAAVMEYLNRPVRTPR